MKMDWSSVVSSISPFVVRIRTQYQYGTGFIFWQTKDLCCIATANHVIEPANQPEWEQPIHITQPNGNTLCLYKEQRHIVPKLSEGDSAAILLHKTGLDLPPRCLPLWDSSTEIPIGTEVGWLGYPVLVDQTILQPSFFSGIISNVFPHLAQYAIDGVAINGVSGGPLFYKLDKMSPHVIGTISSYFTNRIKIEGGVEDRPGMALSHSFSAFKSVIENLKTLEDAKSASAQSEIKDDSIKT
jgi:hypothetical protein